MNTKREARLRRSRGPRAQIKRLRKIRLCVYRTPRHIYAQLINEDGDRVLASASTLDAALKAQLKNGGNKDAAAAVGRAIAQRGIEAGVKSVAFDRSGFKYHGRVQVLADAAREAGLEF